MRTPAALLVVALGFSLSACGRDTQQAAPVQTAAVERRDIVVDVQATGTVEPINVVDVKSKASGIITAMPVDVGSQVETGDLLVQIDARNVRNQYAQTLADVRAAQANLAVTQAQLERSNELFKQRIITATENETATLAAANAKAQLARAQASLDISRQSLEDATIRAPIAGTVIQKSVSAGQVITSATGAFGGGTSLLLMADLGQVRVRAMVNETDIGGVQPGQPATITVDAYPTRPFQGTVEKVEPQAVVDQSVTMFPVLVSVANTERLLMPGMNGEVSILIQRAQNVVAIPNDAVGTARQAPMVASALGLDPAAVQRQVEQQMASLGQGGRGAGDGAGGGAGGGAGRGAGAAGRVQEVSGGEIVQPGARDSSAVSTGAPELGLARGTRARPGLVFVKQGTGFVPRVVRMGLANYDYTQAVSGVQPGDQVALIAVLALQAEQQQRLQRIRGMTGGGVPGMQRQNSTSSNRGGGPD